MQDFLKTYVQASNLDDKQYDFYFPEGVKRSDFLLFNKQLICEVKEVQNIKVKNKIEKLAQRIDLPEEDFKRNLYNSIEEALSKANKQILATKKALNIPSAFGLIILENTIPNDLSILSLLDAAARKMPGGLINTDCILCLDFVNAFSNSEGEPFQPAQIVLRSPEEKVSEFLILLIKDFCEQNGTPLLLKDWKIEKGSQDWLINTEGEYTNYTAKIDFNLPIFNKKYTWKHQLKYFLNRWWWIIPLPFIYYDWFIR